MLSITINQNTEKGYFWVGMNLEHYEFKTYLDMMKFVSVVLENEDVC